MTNSSFTVRTKLAACSGPEKLNIYPVANIDGYAIVKIAISNTFWAPYALSEVLSQRKSRRYTILKGGIRSRWKRLYSNKHFAKTLSELLCKHCETPKQFGDVLPDVLLGETSPMISNDHTTSNLTPNPGCVGRVKPRFVFQTQAECQPSPGSQLLLYQGQS
ncbi:hypothetical protein CONLIGDRAFT_649948 [Coniochaeta ligniaria NRRL 30616]|uniref:Uncharacterized protein n=1 Tax=Coniochaeta ligniaria NRRL 30616 TaxID=1408157 RepID=A0A1J7J1U0_9PEZI|nr:hypothetical protein CONLIGDRAFT_649948 [Coniochaeta ligniaria NRRL 30616]